MVGSATPRSEAVSEFTRVLAGPAAFLHHAQPLPARAAILYNRQALLAIWIPGSIALLRFGEKSGFAKIQGFTYKESSNGNQNDSAPIPMVMGIDARFREVTSLHINDLSSQPLVQCRERSHQFLCNGV